MKKSKLVIVVTLLVIVLLGTSACVNSPSDNPSKEIEQSKSDAIKSTDESTSTNDSSIDSPIESDNTIDDNEPVSNTPKQDAKEQKKVSESSDSNVKASEDENSLSQYSNEQIEYARVWLQLGPNQDIDELNVRHIPAGEPINPNDDTSANYPEDVIELAGSRLVDGSVTYSGNGDGTVNVYNVPLRWDGNYPAGEKFYIDIVESAELEHVAPSEDEKVIALIKLLNIH